MKKTVVGIFLIFLGFASPATVLAATLSLSPASATFNKSCPFSLDIVLDTGDAQTDGTDAIVFYDNSRFSASSISTGSIYSDYPGNSIDDTNGKITISGLASVSSAFKGKGTLATISFTVKDNAQTGVSQIKFDFDPNDKSKTTDSNVVEHGTTNELLASVTNGSYTVGSGTCGASPSPAPGTGGPGGTGTISKGVGGATPSAQPKSLDQAVGGKTGTPELTFTIAIIGSALTILGVLGLAFL